jgi:acetyl esterase
MSDALKLPSDVHPQVRTALEALAKANLPAIESLTPAQAREQINAMARARGGEPAPIARTEDRAVPGPAGPIPVRVYWPNATGTLPAVLYFHGGGHVIGNLDTHDRIVRNLCAGAEAVFISVDYRMGPEHRFPAAVDDSWAALQWLVAAAPGLGVDPGQIAVCGDSAGANLAAVVALLARDAAGPPIKLQALVYPVADYGFGTPSYERYASGYGVLTRAAMAWFRNHYLATPADAEDWRASPLKAASLAGVAPAIVVAAECDVLHDEGARYADALRRAGVAVEYEDYAGMIHGFFGMAPDVDGAVAAQGRVASALKRALAR